MREAIRDVEDENKKLTSHDAKASRLLTATLHVLILLLLNSHCYRIMGAPVRASVQTENNNNQQHLREFLFVPLPLLLILPYTIIH